MPKIPSALTPTTNRIPTLISLAIWNDGPNASAAIASIAVVTEMTGANQKIHASALSGMMSSLIRDRKSTRLNSSHGYISYAVFCLKKKKKETGVDHTHGAHRPPPTVTALNATK